ncbi:hypothetical protein ACFFTM_00890 [Pseudoduganella plicata]|uniref:Uncharacterized protein n=1 Tax=Pseudoduganella plicata TaxID=321984 RepID=A0A4P7BDF5_9BURK|nr:hypothetical protein [Pseudoduganella plicata]QBQ36584.1 hypothetical protein E1742_10735 [Pseudoduganella plicata]GGY74212.1 hypothetical protein GCM10007388_03220 [Pseudoduganella plicata]
MSKPSRLPAVAGTLAGLLAAGLGVLYFYPHGGKTPAPAALPAPAAMSAMSPARLTREQAVQRLMALPELRAWSAAIERNSGGAHRGAVIEYDPAPRLVDGKPYYQMSFVENTPQAAVTWQGFLVAVAGGDILVEDEANDTLLDVERWRREQQPLQRVAPHQETR